MNIANAATNTQVAINTNSMDALLQASPVVQLTLLILVGLSVFCWAIAYTKYRQLKQVRDANDSFTNKFWKVSSLDTLYGDIDDYPNSSMARIFKSAYLEMKKLAESPLVAKAGADKPQLSGLDNLERVIRKSTENELAKLETRLTVLATTGSTGPFIGLFGTVWGIMGSFHKIGATGNASLAVVAPGISEALIATAIGLAAAIPAVVLYNNFIARVRREEIELNNFSTDFLNIVKRNFFKGE
ncbi:protein TolQ [Bdellovibrio sp. HCB337]|uniref:protein TolQ n=1 Tax=Bdellovibrio sp. HCB337 TaxID=3394358 RepID=UPI0039A75ED4